MREDGGVIQIEYVFGRRLTGFIITTMLPTVSANVIGMSVFTILDIQYAVAQAKPVFSALTHTMTDSCFTKRLQICEYYSIK